MKKIFTILLASAFILPMTQSCDSKKGTTADSATTDTTAVAATDSVKAQTEPQGFSLMSLLSPLGEGYMIKQEISDELPSMGFTLSNTEEVKNSDISPSAGAVLCEQKTYTKDNLKVNVITAIDEDNAGLENVEIVFPTQEEMDAFLEKAKQEGMKDKSKNQYFIGSSDSQIVNITVRGTTLLLAAGL